MLKQNLTAAVSAVLAISAAPLPVAAQQAMDGIQEILVTARRREESLQEVPVAISAFGGEQLEERGVSTVQDLDFQLPTVQITGSPTANAANTVYRVRGVPGVVVYEDGVPIISQTAQNIIDVERIEVLRGPQGTLFGRAAIGGAIQILSRKPVHEFRAETGLAFGSNDRIDITGRVNIPVTDTFAAKFTGSSLRRDGFVESAGVSYLSFGSQDDKLARVDLLWTPSDRFEGRLIYTYNEQTSNGSPTTNLSIDPVCPGDPVPDQWQGRDGTSRFTAPNALCILRTVDTNPGVAGVQPWDTQFHEYASREEYKTSISDEKELRYRQENESAILDLTFSLNDSIDFRWVNGFRTFENRSGETLDGTNLDIYQRTVYDIPTENEQRTSELQMLFNGERFSGTTGIYYEYRPGNKGKRVSWGNSELLNPTLRAAAEAAYPGSTLTPAELNALYPVGSQGYVALRDGDPATVPTTRPFASLNSASAPFYIGRVVSPNVTQNKTEIMAAFAEWSASITEALNLTLGIRYTDQTNTSYSWNASRQPNIGLIPDTCCEVNPGVDYLAVTGAPTGVNESTLEQWTPRVSLQYQWTPEIMTYLTYAKGATVGGINNNPPAPLTPFPFLGEKVKNYEFGLRSDLFDRRLRLNATVFFTDYSNLIAQEEIVVGTYVSFNADAEVKGLEVEGAWRITDGLSFNYALGYLDAKYTSIGTTQNLRPGTPFANAPEFAYSTGLQQVWRLDAGGSVALRGDWSWQDETNSILERLNTVELDSYGMLNSRLTYTSADGTWDASLSGTNLTDLYYWTTGFQVTGATQVTLGRPREFALNFNYRFD